MSNSKVTATIIFIILLNNIALSKVSAQVMAKPPMQGNTTHQGSLQNQPTHKPRPTATQAATPGQATATAQAAPAQQAPSAAKSANSTSTENSNVHAPLHPDTSAGPMKRKNNGISTTAKE